MPGPPNTMLPDSTTTSPPRHEDGMLSDGGGKMVTLPPCRVCGERGTGYHYGVNTCDACKAFFRRCMIRKTELQCKKKGTCPVGAGQRLVCPACRYKKCLSVGMSKDAIKIGRYNMNMVTNNILEVKKLRLQERISPQGHLISEKNERRKELDKVIDRLVAVIRKHSPYVTNELYEKERRFLEKRQLNSELFGISKRLPLEEYKSIFKETKLDIDGRKNVYQQMMDSANDKITGYLYFIREIPGFTSLCIDDQKKIVAAGSMDRWVMTFSSWLNLDDMLFSYPYHDDLVFDLNDAELFTDDIDQWQGFWTMISRVQRLDLTEQETAVASAIACMNAGMGLTPEAGPIVAGAIDFLVEALQYLLEESHDPTDLVLPKLIQVLTDLRAYSQFGRQTQELWNDLEGYNMSVLHKQFCNLSLDNDA